MVSPRLALPLTLHNNAYMFVLMGDKMVFRRYRFFILFIYIVLYCVLYYIVYCIILCIYLILCLLLQITGLGLSPSHTRLYILHV